MTEAKQEEVTGQKEAEIKEDQQQTTEKPPEQQVEHKNAQLSVVVSDLPEGVTIKDVSEFCKRIGVIATHPETGEDLILLNPKSKRATVTYAYPESANHAIEFLNGELFLASGERVKVDRAVREPFDFSKWKGAMKMSRKFHSYFGAEEKLDSSEQKRVKIMILKNVFDIDELVKEPELYGQIVKDMTLQCEPFGKVTLVKPIEQNPEGTVIVRFESAQSASIAIGELDQCEYRNRILTAEPWDGNEIKTVAETEEEFQARIDNFHKFQEGESSK